MDALSASWLAEISNRTESRAGNGAPGYLFIRLLRADTIKVACSGQLPLVALDELKSICLHRRLEKLRSSRIYLRIALREPASRYLVPRPLLALDGGSVRRQRDEPCLDRRAQRLRVDGRPFWAELRLTSVSELFMTERSGPRKLGEARLSITPPRAKVSRLFRSEGPSTGLEI
jgi:hypothetical protein